MSDPVLNQDSIRSNDSPHFEARSLQELFCIEVFAGSGKLTAALRSLGLRDSFGIDIKLPQHLRSPIIKYNLLQPDHVKLVQDLIASPFCIYVHFAPPCGTSSRARLIQRRGRWNPPILRTDQHPDGLPHLTGVLLTRVQSANELYQVTCDLVEFCILHRKYFSVENPGRSFMWATRPFLKLTQKHLFSEVYFHHCRYGSSRRKLTKLLHNIPSFQLLEAFCDQQHTHEPWGRSPSGQWSTAEETTYPWELCRALAAKLALQLEKDGHNCTPPVFALQEASLQTMRATTDLQPRRGLPPMVPAFKQIVQQPDSQPLPENARRLTTHSRGVIASGTSGHSENIISFNKPGTTDAQKGQHSDIKNATTVGIHFSPDEFVQQALKIGHPSRLHSFFPIEMEEVVNHYLKSPAHKLALDRTEEIKRWLHLSRSTVDAEKALKATMSERRRTVLSGKNLTLFKQLLEEAGHGDRDLVKHSTQGFDLTGSLPESQVFARKVRPAAISSNELRRIADLSREGMIQTVTSSGDADLDDQLYSATLKEVSKGFLVGPLDPNTLPPGSTLTRRFGVKQKSKTRPIDDYKASFVNSSVSQTETATVHTIDHIASLIACILRFSESLDSQTELSAKTWDLADAYKQIPLSDHAFEKDAYLVVYCPQKQSADVFQQKVLPFGSVASVTAFLRVAHGIWKLGTSLLKLMWTSYFDDFFSVTSTETSRHTDMIVSSMFCLLGWRLSSDKLIDYSTMCKVLGVEFDLTMSGAGLAAVSNTAERVRELSEMLGEVVASKVLKRAEGERLRGRLQFASGQLFGRKARNNLRMISKHIASGRQTLDDSTSSALEELRVQLLDNAPRLIVGPMSDHITYMWMLRLIWMDTQVSAG